MKIKNWLFTAMLALATVGHAATNDLTGLLQKGLFEEEANRDLTAAIANYQSLANAFDKDRQLAATAIFRLGECYRKLGNTNEAVVQYQRILKEFSDQQTLVTLSRQNLAGLNPRPSVASGRLESLEEVRAHLEKARMDVAAIDEMTGTNRLASLASFFGTDDIIKTFTQNRETLKKREADLLRTYLPENTIVKDTKRQIEAAQSTIDTRADKLATGAHTWLTAMENAYRERVNSSTSSSEDPALDATVAQVEATAVSLQAQLDGITKMQHDQARIYVQQNFPNPILTTLMQELDLAQQSLIKLKLDYTPDHPKYQNAKEAVDDLNAKIDSQVNGIIQSLRGKLAESEIKLRLLQKRQGELAGIGGGGSPSSQESPSTDEEQQEIRRIQAMIQNSPDLINAPGWSGDANSSFTPLVAAATKGQLVVAKYLLDHGADVNGLNPNQGVPLFAAAENGHKAMVELLLARGADVNGARGPNPLYEAVSRGFTGVVDVLLANKANLNAGYDKRPLHAAASKGDTNLIQLLISHGADVNAIDFGSNTPLYLAVDKNHSDAVRMLLAAKAAVDLPDRDGNTPLHVAADKGFTEIVSLLLNSGAVVDATNKNNATPLLLAVFRGRVDVTRVLLDHKADPNHSGKATDPFRANNLTEFSPVYRAIDVFNGEILKLLLDAGASLDGLGQSALFYAVDHNAVEGVRMLLEHGADPNRVEDGGPALSKAVINRRDKRIVAALLDKGADPNVRDVDGLPPLFRAQDAEIADLLITHKADVNARARNGMTALMQQVWQTNYLKVLLENGANVDLQETNGNTALHQAVYYSIPAATAILLEAKANPNIQNNRGYTPLDLVEGWKHGANVYAMLTPYAGNGTPPQLGTPEKIADLLVKAGGLANLPKRDRIEVRRGANSALTLSKDSQGRNQMSLLETIACRYGLLSRNASGEWEMKRQVWRSVFDATLRFPDFKKVVVYRRTENSAKQTALNVDVEDILNSGDCSRDVWLQWGDVVEIPEADHPVDEQWEGLSKTNVTSLFKCLTRQMTVKIKGENTILTLAPELVQTQNMFAPNEYAWNLTRASFMLRSVLDNSKLIRVSSDLARVKVTRIDPTTKKTTEWIVDCTDNNQSGLWLRDGDVIEVPEK